MSGTHSLTRRTLIWGAALLLLALPVIAIVNGWIGEANWPLRTLRINSGLARVDLALVRARVLPYAEQGYFAIDLAGARQAIAQLPWVDSVTLRKHWPDVLEINVGEYRPLAWWGDTHVVSEHGTLFPLAGIQWPQPLPRLHGPEAKVDEVIAFWREAKTLFAAAGIGVDAVNLDARGNWHLVLSGGAEITLGRNAPQQHLRRFARVLPRLLTTHGAPLRRADLRYPNGFALAWGDRT